MNKSKLLLVIVCLFLVHAQIAAALDIGTSPLSPNRKVSPTETSQFLCFLRQFNILTFALAMYQLDVEERLPKEAILDKLTPDLSVWEHEFNIAFDIENMDFKKKGFTRYYPFSANGKDFIIRIFDIRERHFLPDFEVFYEGVFDNSEIGFQILPGIKTILNSRKAERLPLETLTRRSTSP